MTDTDLTAPEAVERWHEEVHGMKAGPALFEDQQEYVRYEDYAALSAVLDAERFELDLMRSSGIAEVAAQNPQVMEYMEHWEARADALKAELAEAVGVLQQVKDYRYDPHIGIKLNHLEAFLARHQKDTAT